MQQNNPTGDEEQTKQAPWHPLRAQEGYQEQGHLKQKTSYQKLVKTVSVWLGHYGPGLISSYQQRWETEMWHQYITTPKKRAEQECNVPGKKLLFRFHSRNRSTVNNLDSSTEQTVTGLAPYSHNARNSSTIKSQKAHVGAFWSRETKRPQGLNLQNPIFCYPAPQALLHISINVATGKTKPHK